VVEASAAAMKATTGTRLTAKGSEG
jgi:hypothetical protein